MVLEIREYIELIYILDPFEGHKQIYIIINYANYFFFNRKNVVE